MKPASLLEKYKKKERERVKSGFKPRDGADKLDRQLSEYTYMKNEKNEKEFLAFIRKLGENGLVRNIEIKRLRKALMIKFISKNRIVQHLINEKKIELNIINKIIK